MAYPPFAAMSLYRSEGETPEAAIEPLRRLKAKLLNLPGLRILGPLESPIARVKDRYRMQLILKASTRSSLSEALQLAPLHPGDSITLDRDPVNFGV